MKRIQKLFKWFVFSVLLGCSPQIQTSKVTPHDEDISVYRPVYPEITLDSVLTQSEVRTSESIPRIDKFHDLSTELDSLLDTIAVNSSTKGFIQAYSVQVYTGSSRTSAQEVKSKVYQVMPDVIPELSYIQPNFKVKVGIYHTRFEAYKTLSKLKDEFPNAIIIPERIRTSR